jgi:hypothetical protein
MEKDIPIKLNQKVFNRFTHIWQSRLQTKIRRDKEGHFILIKGKSHQEYITVVYTDTPNVGAWNFIKQTLVNIKAQIDPNVIIVDDFALLHSYQQVSHPNKKSKQKHQR